MELSLYTPPVTPRGEFLDQLVIAPTEDKLSETSHKNESFDSRKELVGSNNLPLLKPFELENNNFTEESRNIMREKNVITNCKILPKITNVQKTNINIATIFQDISLDNQNIQKHRHLLANTNSMTEIVKDFDHTLFHDALCKESSISSLSTQYEIESNQCERNNIQLNNIENCLKVNVNTGKLSNATNLESDINNLSMINDSALYTSDNDLNIDAMLEQVLNNENCITEEINDDWLDLLF